MQFITILVLAFLSPDVISDDFAAQWSHELVDNPGDPIPYSLVMLCVESDGEYAVDGIMVSKDTIWVTDPNGISITENTVLEHDYVCVGNGFVLNAHGITFDGDGHSITYSNSEYGYAVCSNGRNNLNIKNCNIIKGAWNGDSLAISLDEADNSILEYNCITINNSNENYAIQIEGKDYVVIYNTIDVIGNQPCGISIISPSQDGQVIFNEIQARACPINLY